MCTQCWVYSGESATRYMTSRGLLSNGSKNGTLKTKVLFSIVSDPLQGHCRSCRDSHRVGPSQGGLPDWAGATNQRLRGTQLCGRWGECSYRESGKAEALGKDPACSGPNGRVQGTQRGDTKGRVQGTGETQVRQSRGDPCWASAAPARMAEEDSGMV